MSEVRCVICRGPVEMWFGGGGYGHNPDPWPQVNVSDDKFRCCNWCNQQIVIPLRLRMAGAFR